MSEIDSSDNETQEEKNEDGLPPMPRKRFYRQRAHVNPFSFQNVEYPPTPDE